MFKTRLLSGIVLVILALVLIITGGEVLLFSTLAISCIGMFELYRVLLRSPVEFYSGQDDAFYGIYDSSDVRICVFVSEVSCK